MRDASPRFEQVRKLEVTDEVTVFDCGHPALNQFLLKYALLNQKANAAQTYVVCEKGTATVAGFYSLAVGSVESSVAAARLVKGLARHPIPVMLLARLAINRPYQGFGLGKALLKDALLRTAQAADLAGIRAVLVHAKDAAARNWYRSFGFEPSPTDPYHLFLLIKEIRALLA